MKTDISPMDSPELRKLACKVFARMGGLAKSAKKAKAVRNNGKLGGRGHTRAKRLAHAN